MTTDDPKPDLPPAIQGICIVIQRNGNTTPTVSCLSRTDKATFRALMTNASVTEAEVYEITGATLIGSKTVAVLGEGVFDEKA
jgi:hypothetical protein